MTRYADDLSYVHHTGFADLARGAARFVVDLIGPERRRVVDLGCGSGIVLRALTDAGHEAIGVDLSPAMLALAKRTAPRARLLQGSLYRVPLPSTDLILAIGEPLNYLEPDARPPALAAFFRKVARALPRGGRFLFDVIVDAPGRPLSRRAWAAGEDWAVLVDTTEDAARTRLTRDVTSFVRRGRRWRRTRELHHVRVLRTVDLRRLLRDAGFAVRVRTSYGEHPLAERRRAFLCTKR
ncbi:MAG: class I SAM-dependent methyltransferase [Deltaproteobacteria bacterium]|nr:class I SAM-dependent methyltransferase [Deltaproteobacteria bacterium]